MLFRSGPAWLDPTAAVLDLPAAMDAVAQTDVVLRQVPVLEFQAALAANRQLSTTMLTGVARAHREQTELAVSRLAKGAEARCAEWLLQHAESNDKGVCAVQLQQRKRLIAAQLGIAPETFSRVLRHLREHGLIAGTGNVLARNLKIDLYDLPSAVDRAINGNRHPIDLGLVRIINADGSRAERVFSVMAGMGLDAKIFQKTDPKLKKAIGWVAYIDGGLKSLPTLFERMDVSVDGREPRNLKVVSLIIGNVGWLPGRITLMPDAALDDGILDVAAVGPRRFWNWIDFWGRVTWVENLRENRQLRHLIDQTADVRTLENLNGKKIRVTPENPVFIQLDGDPMGSVLEAEFEVQPRAVTVRL